MIGLWIAGAVAGFAVAVAASRPAVSSASDLAARTSLPPFVIGITVMAVGTDLPEIANSITASIAGHGDVNVGDSLGSAATQATLILGLLPWLGRAMPTDDSGRMVAGWLTVASLVVVALLVLDGHLGRIDALILIACWIGGSALIERRSREFSQVELPPPSKSAAGSALRLLVALVVLAAATTLAVASIIEIAEVLGIPEFLVSFFGASIGTSLPELVANVTALRRGALGLALGGIVGSSFVDSTLSISAGPLLAPTDVTASLAVRGAIGAIVAVTAATVLLSSVRTLDRRVGSLLIVVYFTLFLIVR